MAKRKSLNRVSRRYSKRRSIDSLGSGHLDPDTFIVDEEQTFWWNNLEENTFPPHSMIYSENETPKMLNANSRIDSSQGSDPTEWWKNLDSDSESIASRRSRRSAAIVKSRILQTSTDTSESEKELNLRKKKVHLKASNRKSINNVFASVLNDTETTTPLHIDSDSESLQGRSQENEEDNNSSSTSKILKSKPSIFKTRRGGDGMKDQNAFQDVLTENNVLNASTAKTSVAFEKKSSQRSMHRNINTSKDHIDDQRKSIRALEDIETGSLLPNVEKAVSENNVEIESSDESIVIHRQRLKFKSRFMQQARKNIEKNAFADVLVDDFSNANSSTSNSNKEENIHRSLMSRSSLKKSNANSNMPKSSPIRKSPRLSLNISKKQQLDVSVEDKDNIESSLSSSSLDNDESRGIKRSVFLKPKLRILKHIRKHSTNPFEEILKQDNISDRSNVSLEDNRASSERETTTSINQKREATQKNPQSEKSSATNEENSYEISLELSSNVEKSRSKESNILLEDENTLLENNGLNNASKSVSRKSVIDNSSEEKISNLKFIKEKTLKESVHANATSGDRLSTNKLVIQDASDDSHTGIYVERDVSTAESSSDKEFGLTRNSLRIRSETPVNIEVHEANDNLHNDVNREHDSSTLKRSSKITPSKEARLTRNSLRNRSETPVNIEVHEANDNLHNDVNREHDSSTLKRSSKITPSKEARLTRNSLRIRSETPVNIEVHEANDNLLNDVDREHGSSTLKRSSKLTPSKEARLTRNSLRIRSETPVNIEVHEANDNLHNDANREHDSSTFKRSSKLTPSKEARLTRNSLRIRSETLKPANIKEHEDINNSRNSTNSEHDSSTLKRSFKLTPSKETRLTRNSLRIRSETPVNIEVREANDNLHNDVNREHDSSTLKRSSKITPGKEVRLTRNSLRNRSETSKPTNIEVHEDINNSRNDANSEHDSNILKRLSKSNPSKEGHLTRNSSRNQSEILKSMNKNTEVSKRSMNFISNNDEDYNINVDSESTTDSTVYLITRADVEPEVNTNIRIQKSTSLSTEKEITDDENAEPATQTIQRNSSSTKSATNNKVNQSKIPKPTSKNIEASKRSTNFADIEEDNNINADSETSDSISHVTRADIHSKDNTNKGIQKSTILSTEKEIIGDENAEPTIQTIQRNSLTEPGTSKTINRQSIQNSNRTSIKDREIAHRQKSLGKSQNYRNTPTKSSSKDISSNKQSSSKTVKKIDDFFIKVKETSTKQLSERAQKSQVFDNEKMKKIKMELEKLKSREMATMKRNSIDKKASAVQKERVKFDIPKQNTKKKKPLMNSTKVVDKAFLVYGKVYRAPRLPRPKHWATDRLYKFLWKRLEPKYKLATRVRSEKFVQELATIVTIIERRKNYENYKTELKALMKEMARLKLINTRMDFYHFCQDYLPYEFRVKVIPMSLPGNERNIPFNSKNLHTPLLDTE
ncbi:PREDICTED: putative uncharacterized protein DDB_G0282133 [Trachymyrmex septentrionalis]|uniref:putative uncharacterized protein DDB_G0282133 n=1 Tax=Trachymyrmex septentrionalis TaxID=34720 RepID=UPI00084F84F8|nr:PREDICTED: putative uncharacterized protein DDB_G0282133 [Trachymyrmex septentrionalis]